MDVGQLTFSVSEEWKKIKEKHPWISFLPEEARDSEGNEFMRKRSGNVLYIKTEDGYKCINCNSEIMTVKVAHAIWDGPFPCSGSGSCAYENIPYCPKCEKEPNYHGSPITP